MVTGVHVNSNLRVFPLSGTMQTCPLLAYRKKLMNRVIIQDAGIHPAVFLFGAFVCFGIIFFVLMRPAARGESLIQRIIASTILVLMATVPFIPIVTYYTLDHDVTAKAALREEVGVTQLTLDDKNSFKNLRCDFFTSNGTYDAKWVRDGEDLISGTLTVQRYSDGSCSYEVDKRVHSFD